METDGLTAIHEPSKETYSFPLHALCGGKELDMTMSFSVHL